MFDGNLRTQVDRGLTPIGRSLVKTGITPDVITVIGIVMSGVAAVTIGAGYLRVGFLFLLLTAIPDALDGAVARAAGTGSSRGLFRLGERSTHRRDALRRCCVVPREHRTGPHHDVAGGDHGSRHVHLVPAGQGRVARLGCQGRHHGTCRAHRRARLRTAVPGAADRHPLGDAGPHRHHRRPAVREGLEAGHRRARSSHPSPPGPAPAATRTSVEPLWRQRMRERREARNG